MLNLIIALIKTMGNTYTNKYKLLHDRILEYNDIHPIELSEKELASLSEECIIKMFNKYSIIYCGMKFSKYRSLKARINLNITPFVLRNCSELARLSVVKHHLHKYPEIVCLDINFIIDDKKIVPNEQLKSIYFEYPNFPWNHLEVYRKHPD